MISNLNDYNYIESVTVQIKHGKTKPFLIIFVYRPPDKHVVYFAEFESFIIVVGIENSEPIIMGDTNCNYLKPSSNNT